MCKKCDTYDRDHIMLSTNFYFQVVAICYLMINGIYDKNFRMRGSAAYSQKYFTWGIRLLHSWIVEKVEKVGAINANFSLTYRFSANLYSPFSILFGFKFFQFANHLWIGVARGIRVGHSPLPLSPDRGKTKFFILKSWICMTNTCDCRFIITGSIAIAISCTARSTSYIITDYLTTNFHKLMGAKINSPDEKK